VDAHDERNRTWDRFELWVMNVLGTGSVYYTSRMGKAHSAPSAAGTCEPEPCELRVIY
jgi:hypothetical protein